MAVIDLAMEARFGRIEDRLAHIEERLEHVATSADLAEVSRQLAILSTRLDNVPGKWVVWVFMFSTTIPIYGILVTLLWTAIHH